MIKQKYHTGTVDKQLLRENIMDIIFSVKSISHNNLRCINRDGRLRAHTGVICFFFLE